MSNNDIYFLIRKYRELSTEEQNEFLKEIFVNGYFGSYESNVVDGFKKTLSKGSNNPNKEETEKYRQELENKINKVVDLFLDNINSRDEELKRRIFQKFLSSYENIALNTKKEICGEKHDFSGWEKVEGKVPIYDEDGKFEEYFKGEYFVRECYYCGAIEKAYSKEEIEEQPIKKQIYTLNNKKNSH